MIALLATALAHPLVDALEEELARTDELTLPEAPPLYSLRYHLGLLDQVEIEAAFGSLMGQNTQPYHRLGIELRVGSPELDNSGVDSWSNGFGDARLADVPSPLHTRQVAWRETDQAYKQSVEQYARKLSQFEPEEDHPGDYWVMEPVQADDGEPPPPDWNGLEDLALGLSARFLPAGDRLFLGNATIGGETGDHWVLGRDGTRVHRPLGEVSVRAYAALLTGDGELLTDQRYWTARDRHGLPDPAEMEREVDAMRDGLVARADADTLADEYVGPVLFEGAAARDLFRFLLVPQVEGTPAETSTLFGGLGESGPTVRVGRRVLPEGWSVDDDPQRDPEAGVAYAHDWDGTKAQAVELVEDGIVRDLLMSRVPRKGRAPNGHGRGTFGQVAAGRAAQLRVEPDRTKARKKLVKRGLKMAAAYGHDHIIVVRRLQHDAVRSAAGVYTRDEGLRLPPPVELVKLGSDGSEEVLRGAEFASVQRYLLRDIALAGPMSSGAFLAPMDPDNSYLGITQGLPTLITAPDVLVREIELVPSTRDPRNKPVLSLPSPPETP